MENWIDEVCNFESAHNLESGPLKNAIASELEKYGYPAHIINRGASMEHYPEEIHSVEAYQNLVRASCAYNYMTNDARRDKPSSKILFHSERVTSHSTNTHTDLQLLTKAKRTKETDPSLTETLWSNILHKSHIPSSVRNKQKFIVYNTRGVFTGGTIALTMLYLQMLHLGYNVTHCHESNFDSDECTTPSGKHRNLFVSLRLDLICHATQASRL